MSFPRVAALILLGSALAIPQQTTPPQEPLKTFVSTTNEVILPITVTDDKGEVHSVGPYEHAFGPNPRVLVAAEFDWQAVRIPHVGTFGPGGSIGIVSMSRPALISGTNTSSAEDTSLLSRCVT